MRHVAELLWAIAVAGTTTYLTFLKEPPESAWWWLLAVFLLCCPVIDGEKK